MPAPVGERLLVSVLGLSCMFLLGVALVPWLFDPADYLAAGPGDQATVELAEAPMTPRFDPPPIEQFAAIVERPIFTATRRSARRQPVAPSAPASSRGLILGRYQVVGVVVTPGNRLVLLRRLGGAETIRLKEGEEIDGWTLVNVTRNDVVLESGGRREKIEVRDKTRKGIRVQ